MGAAAKCLWCNRSEGALTEINAPAMGSLAPDSVVSVHPEHSQEARTFLTFARRWSGTFLWGVLASVAVTQASVFAIVTLHGLGMETGARVATAMPFVAFSAIGLQCLFLPFATPETVRWLGLRRSIRLCQAAGLVLALGGLVLLVLVQGLY